MTVHYLQNNKAALLRSFELLVSPRTIFSIALGNSRLLFLLEDKNLVMLNSINSLALARSFVQLVVTSHKFTFLGFYSRNSVCCFKTLKITLDIQRVTC